MARAVPAEGRWAAKITLRDGRGGKIRTCGPLLPKQVLYQAELRPDGGMWVA